MGDGDSRKPTRPGEEEAVRRAQVQPTDEDVAGHALRGGQETNERSEDEQDTEGHNLLAMSDYYVQSKTGRQADVDRDARQRALVKEAKESKQKR